MKIIAALLMGFFIIASQT